MSLDVKWKRKIKDIQKKDIDMHYNNALAMREQDTAGVMSLTSNRKEK